MLRRLLLILLLALGGAATAQSFPPFTGLVVDAAGVLPAPVKAELTAKLEALQKDTHRQLVVATIPDLQGYPLEDYGYRLLRAWGVGLKDVNNGAILFIAPNEAPGHRGPRLEVGYGLELVLTDAFASQMINGQMMPRLKAGDVGGAVQAGADAVIQQLRASPDEAKARTDAAAAAFDQAHRHARSGGGGVPVGLIFWGVVALFVVLPMLRGRRRGFAGTNYGGSNLPIVLWGLANEFGNSRRGGWSGSSGWSDGGGDGGWGGGGSDGSWGGGGFTGGGGGSGGGGGASGELVSMRLTSADRASVTAAVTAAEARTDGEIVTAVAARSDAYHDVALHWAVLAMLGMLALLAWRPDIAETMVGWVGDPWARVTPTGELFVAALVLTTLAFLLVRLLFARQPLRLALTPSATKERRVRRRALELFRLRVQGRTRAATGVLLYLSLAERRAEIVADAAIHSRVAHEVWGEAMAALLAQVRDGRPGQGMADCVARIGAVLAEHLPRSADDTNELPDWLIEL